ncbi:hypothetical protein J1N35_033929 [Gossypium stocksii]|uniref:Uncharacterized protein n=1 Tax=Gossypium stocksii TaxID=47602 RepID=A0A9D3UT14_9ROSI|nr:hypothetical protein J1N35_033929 [Gossypium stocksii]
MDFNCLQKVFIEFLNFNVYKSKGKDWENFWRKWKQSVDFFIPSTLKGEEEEENLEGSIDFEQALTTDEATTEPTN